MSIASITVSDIGIFALCVALGLTWVSIVHRFLKGNDTGAASEDSGETPAGSGH